MSRSRIKLKLIRVGDKNQITYLQRHVASVAGPILEIGSKDYGSTASFRDVFPANEYVGIDMASGAGVDVVVDLVGGIGYLQPGSFGLIVCCSVLEHVSKPWKMAENITDLLAPGGVLYLSVPWVWRYHPYPDDYFRFSVRGVEALFPDLTWDHRAYSTSVEGEFIAIETHTEDDRMAEYASDGKQRRKYLPCLMVNMIGTKAA